MSMPLDNSTFPPPPFDHVQDKITEWATWYEGDTNELAQLYGGIAGGGVATKYQFFGGVVGRLARFFWGTPPSRGATTSPKLHIPMAEEIATQGSYQLFKNPPEITTTSQLHQDRIDAFIDDGLFIKLLEASELACALSGVYLRVGYDTDVSELPVLSIHSPDMAVPSFYFGEMTSVILWQILDDTGGKVVRHLELHTPGMIEHAVFTGDHRNIGIQQPLDSRPETEMLEPFVPTGIPDELDVIYVPNLKTRIWRNKGAAANLGRSDFGSSGCLLSMDALDEVYTSWMRDVRMAKSRILVPQHYLATEGRGKGAFMDMDQEVFVQLNSLAGKDKMELTPNQFAIRWQEHLSTCTELIERILSAAGYSTQTFGFTGDVAMTATEANSRERRTFDTRAVKVEMWKRKLKCLVELMLTVDHLMGNSSMFVPSREEEILVEFPPAVEENQLTLAQTALALRQAEAASTETLVRMVHPDWDDERVEEEVELITGESEEQQIQTVPITGEPTPDPSEVDPPPPDWIIPTGSGVG